MNIFFLDENPILAAQYQCDKHVVKMVLESTQLMCTVHHLVGSHQVWMYKPTHINHPCTKWLMVCRENFSWLHCHAAALANEYEYRYNKQHKCKNMIDLLWYIKLPSLGSQTTPALAMPDEYKLPSAVDSYRKYYRECKLKTIQCVWTKRGKPQWLL